MHLASVYNPTRPIVKPGVLVVRELLCGQHIHSLPHLKVFLNRIKKALNFRICHPRVKVIILSDGARYNQAVAAAGQALQGQLVLNNLSVGPTELLGCRIVVAATPQTNVAEKVFIAVLTQPVLHH